MRVRAVCVVVAMFVLLPSAAHAQASITGIVKDSSGGVLPGVTVEAASPALIEKVRSAVTDESGRYRIVDLRPGTYAVNFSLTGFQSVRRQGIELPGTFTATVDAELRVGSIEETITVTGESPIVDVQSIRRQTVLDSDDHHVHSSYARVQQPDAADAEHRHAGGRRNGYPGRARHGGLRRRGWAHE